MSPQLASHDESFGQESKITKKLLDGWQMAICEPSNDFLVTLDSLSPNKESTPLGT